MNIILLANSIKSFAMDHYVPFQGFDHGPIVCKVVSVLPVTATDVMRALEYICQKGV